MVLCAPSSFAQIIDRAPETSSFPSSSTWSLTPASSSSRSSTITSTPSLTTITRTDDRSHTTIFTSRLTAHNATTHNSTTTTDRGNLPLGPAGGDPFSSDPEQSTGSGVLTYYFAFLAVFVVLLFAGAWWIHRRKKRLKALRASSRQDALSRDLDGWAGHRRWVGGAFRGGLRRAQEREEQSREEGLNEMGEAPPPYRARDSIASRGEAGPEASSRNDVNEEANEGPTGPMVPMRALDPDARITSNRPPGYHETVRDAPQDEAESSSAVQRLSFRRANTQDHASSSG